MKFFKKKNLENISLTAKNPDEIVDDVNVDEVKAIRRLANRPRKAIVKKAGKSGKIFRASIAILLILSTLLGGFLIFKGCDNETEGGDLTDSILSKLPNFSDINTLESLIASSNGLDDFDYEFLTASTQDNVRSMHIAGTATDDGVETSRVLSYTISEELYQDIEELKVLVTKINDKYYFTNDFIECTEDEIQAIENQVISALEVTPQKIQDLTYEEKLDLIINHNINIDNNLFMTNLTPKDRYGNLVNFELDGFIYLKQRTEDGKYKFIKTKWKVNQYVKYNGVGEDPAMVDGEFVFNDDLVHNTGIESAWSKAEVKNLSATEVIDEFSKVGEHRVACSILRGDAITQIPDEYLSYDDKKGIWEESAER